MTVSSMARPGGMIAAVVSDAPYEWSWCALSASEPSSTEHPRPHSADTPLSIPMEAPNKRRGGCSRMTELSPTATCHRRHCNSTDAVHVCAHMQVRMPARRLRSRGGRLRRGDRAGFPAGGRHQRQAADPADPAGSHRCPALCPWTCVHVSVCVVLSLRWLNCPAPTLGQHRHRHAHTHTGTRDHTTQTAHQQAIFQHNGRHHLGHGCDPMQAAAVAAITSDSS